MSGAQASHEGAASRSARNAIGGLVAGVLFVVVVGYLSVAAQSSWDGTVLTWTGELVGIKEQSAPWLEFLAMAALITLVVLGGGKVAASQGGRWAVLSFGFISLGVWVVSFLVWPTSQVSLGDELLTGLALWLREAGRNPLAVAVGMTALAQSALTQSPGRQVVE